MKRVFTLLFLLINAVAYGQDTLNVMFYNLYRFPVMPPANRQTILKDILDSYHPDIFMTCELVNESGADHILNVSLNHQQQRYLRAPFVFTQSDTTDPLQQMVFYNKEKLTLVQQRTYKTTVRDINHYTFLLNTENIAGDSIFIDAFVTHLKSSEGPANRQLRLGMIDTFFNHVEDVPNGHYVLLGGDFNFYSAYNEPAYQKLIATNNPVTMVDPIHMPGKWSNNDSFKAIHTQATRISSEGFGTGGASGGMDDRFDYIMMSQNLEQTGVLQYIQDSYKAYGNNGNCFNNRIDAYDCDGEYPLELRQNLYKMSDHVPIVMQLKTDRHFTSVPQLPVAAGIKFPNGNMVKDFLIIDVNKIRLAANDFAVYNSLGQKMLLKTERNGTFISIDFRNVKPGIYYLICAGKNVSFKIVRM